MKKLSIILLLFFTVSQIAWSKGDLLQGKELSSTCVACHGSAAAAPDWPNIEGQHETYLVKQLKAFREGPGGQRDNAVMYGIVASLSDKDIDDLAAYYASLPMVKGEGDADLVALGEKLYRGGNLDSGVTACSACHGPAGLGNGPAKFPMVAGQKAQYIYQQLVAYREGTRLTGPMMPLIAKRMTEEEMRAVSEYMAGLSLNTEE